MKSTLFSKKGAFDAKTGMDLGIVAIFVLAIGLSVVQDSITNLTTAAVNDTATLTGIAATVIAYAPLIVVAVFIYGVARMGGVI